MRLVISICCLYLYFHQLYKKLALFLKTHTFYQFTMQRNYLIFLWFVFQTIVCQNLQTRHQINIGILFPGSSKLKSIIGQQKAKFYVDIGAGDPVYQSNTLELEMDGWRGLNVEPHYAKFSRFVAMRPYQTNLNMAVGEQNKYGILYNQGQNEVSSINQNKEQRKNMTNDITVPFISLKDLCQKYYLQRPVVINIGAKDSVNLILQSNNWLINKCIPDIFVISKDKELYKDTAGYLKQKQYSEFVIQWENVTVFIRSNIFEKYKINYENYCKKMKEKEMIKFDQVLSEVSKFTRKRIDHLPFTDTVRLYFAKKQQPIVFRNANIFNNNPLKYYPINFIQEERPNIRSPIIIVNFDLIQNSLILSDCSFSITRIVTSKLQIINLTISFETHKEQFYIIPNIKGSKLAPKIVVTDERCVESILGGEFFSAGEYLQNEDKIKKNESLGSYIFQVVASVIFFTFFVILGILLVYYFYKSIRRQYKLQEEDKICSTREGLQSSTTN